MRNGSVGSRVVLCLALLIVAGMSPAPANSMVSDDFNDFNLDTGTWAYVDPRGDGSFVFTGTNTPDARLALTIPAGTGHDVWTGGNFAPRFMQPTTDGDFEVEVKFDSLPTRKYQMQGIIVEQDASNFLRFDFYSDGSVLRLFAASFSGGSPTVRGSAVIGGAAPLYMRVSRSGNQWAQSYSVDGANWTTAAVFSFPMTVTSIGPFAGNAGTSPPAFTALIDYFFVTSSPIIPEDGSVVSDATPPFIYNVSALGGQFTLQISWFTDEPASAVVSYGETPSYELGAVNGPALSTWHSVLLQGLDADTNYNVQIRATDVGGNSQATHNFVFWTHPAGLPSPYPAVNLWYGTHQVFGSIGVPQRWVNILGNVSDSDGVAYLTYSLNGGPQMPLSMGPDTRRLASPGDFNVELDFDGLPAGVNDVVITARDALGNITIEAVDVEKVSGRVWPTPYSIDWGTAGRIQDVAQVVDGLWVLQPDGLRPAVLGYDRLVDIGDITWDNYEVSVPITIHGIDPAGYSPPSNGPGVGILLRWPGHTDWGGSQPTIGYYPLGGFGMYRYLNDPAGDRLMIMGNRGATIAQDSSGRKLAFGVPYVFKMRVETIVGQGHRYCLKVWEAQDPEPASWDLEAVEELTDPSSGSFLLIAHHVDATFGNLSAVPLPPVSDTTPPAIDNIGAVATDTEATVSWTTDEPATSVVDYGQTTSYEAGHVSDGGLVTSHSVVLTGLTPGTQYHYRVSSADGSGNAAVSSDRVFSTLLPGGVDPSGIRSDDFHGAFLDTSLWTFVDPVGDGSVSVTGTQALLSVPSGSSHDVWTGGNYSARLMQAANDADFEVEVKFESAPGLRYQLQGLIVEQDAGNYLRFDFYHDGSSLRVFAASVTGGSASTKLNRAIAGGNPLYMRVRRSGSQWTQTYSYDGASWTAGASFLRTLTVTGVGPFAGNAGSPAPAHTAAVDYFFNAASPIVPES